jgi:uncharacterized protein YydD (DUF2326 family)
LISYFGRHGQGAFLDPFKHFAGQPLWDQKVNVSFLLGLNYEHAGRWQSLKDQEDDLKQLQRALKTGVVSNLFNSLGSLESLRVRLDREVIQEAENLASFEVHPSYRDIQEEANRLTFDIHDLTNANVVDEGMISLYERSLEEETPASEQAVADVFAEAGVVLGNLVVRHIDEAQAFQRELLKNRRNFLEGEIGKLRQDIANREAELRSLSEQRAQKLQILQSYGALDEYNKLQSLHREKVSLLDDTKRQTAMWQQMELTKSETTIERERLKLDARSDLENRRPAREGPLLCSMPIPKRSMKRQGSSLLNSEIVGSDSRYRSSARAVRASIT